MSDGKGCKCGAYSYADCGCPDVDWSCGECAKLKAELAEAVRLLDQAETEIDNADRWNVRDAGRESLTGRILSFINKHRSTT